VGWLLAFLTALLLSACADVGSAVTPTPTIRPEPTALPPLDAWTQAMTPIMLDNIQRITQLGRLDAPEPPSTLFAYALSLDNAYLAGLNNDFLIVWDLVTGEIVFGSERLGANVVLFGPDRQQVYTLTATGELHLYDVASGELLEALDAFDQYNGIWAYDAVGGWLALGSDEGAVQVWDMPAGAPVNVLEGPASAIAALAFSPDGAALAAAHANGTVQVWDFAGGQVLATADLMTVISSVAFAPSGRALAVNSGDGVLVLDASTAQGLFRLTEAPSAGLFSFVDQTGTLLLGGVDSDITLWDTAAGRRIAVLPGTRGERPSAAASPDGDILMTTTRTAASFWNLSGLASGTVPRGNASLPEMDVFRTVWTGDGLQILLFEAIGPVRIMGIP
jgi:WD40 repeat protein